MKYSKKDIVKHWGLKIDGAWLLNSDNIIVAWTCPRVAELQKQLLETMYGTDKNIEVAEVKPEEE